MYRSSTRNPSPVSKTLSRIRIARHSVFSTFLPAVALACLCTAQAAAQLPRDITASSSPLTPAQRSEVQTFVDQSVAAMLGDDLRATLHARRALEDPMKDAGARRPFRLAYDDLLTPQLTDVIENADTPVHLQVSCMHLLGAIASEASLDVLSANLSAARPTTRYAAASGIQRAFEAAQQGRATFDTEKRLIELMKQLRTAIGSEQQAEILFADVSACVAAPGNNGAGSAIEASSAGLLTQIQNFSTTKKPDARLTRLHQCMRLIYQRYIKVITFNQNMKPARKALVETSAAAILMAARLGQSMSDQERATYRDELSQLVGICEGILNLSYSEAGAEDTTVSRTFESGQYQQAAILFERRWLGEDGPIYKNSEFGFHPGHIKGLLDG